MRISSLPHSSIAPVSTSAGHLSNSPSGISSTPSSINMRLQAQEASGGFCSCITELIDRICRFLGLSPSQQSTTTAPRVINSVEERITRGIDVLADHFRRDAIARDDGHRSAIVVTMSYNGRTAISFGNATQQKNSLDTINAQIRQLIASQPNVPDNTALNINTAFIKKNRNRTYTFNETGRSLRFPNTLTTGTFADESNESRGSASAMTSTELCGTIDTWSCSHEEKLQIAAFLAGLL